MNHCWQYLFVTYLLHQFNNALVDCSGQREDTAREEVPGSSSRVYQINFFARLPSALFFAAFPSRIGVKSFDSKCSPGSQLIGLTDTFVCAWMT